MKLSPRPVDRLMYHMSRRFTKLLASVLVRCYCSLYPIASVVASAVVIVTSISTSTFVYVIDIRHVYRLMNSTGIFSHKNSRADLPLTNWPTHGEHGGAIGVQGAMDPQ